MTMPLTILTEPNTLLHQKAEPVLSYESSDTLVEALLETLYQTDKGIGLAAPQCGIEKQVFVIDICYRVLGIARPLVFINPRLQHTSNLTVIEEESCLSVPSQSPILVERPLSIKLSYEDAQRQNQEKDFTALEARIIQHELDHLQGVTLLHYASKLQM